MKQGWKPEAENEFVGDMMPFWDGRRFHLFYLLDRDHHTEQNGLGGHQWAHASTSDLLHWEHHPLAVPIGEPGSTDQHGICTGSIFEHGGVYHAWYATRIKRPDGSVYEAICRARSRDLIHFEKSEANPMFGASAGLEARNHRDPFVFQDADGVFHMLVTSSRHVGDTPETQHEEGVLAHYVSPDLEAWTPATPFPPDGGATPECPELFEWNGWWYLVCSQSGRFEYWISRDQLGPWRRARRDTIENNNVFVPRTAEFTGNRRIAVGFLAWRNESRDNGGWTYAGNTIFRELMQDEDGTLTTRFVPEMMPPVAPPLTWQVRNSELECDAFALQKDASPMASVADVPTDATISLRFVLDAETTGFGLLLRADDSLETGYRLNFAPKEKRATLQRWPVQENDSRSDAEDVELNGTVDVIICMKDSLIDVCINNERTLIERAFDYKGTNLGLFGSGAPVSFENLKIAPLL